MQSLLSHASSFSLDLCQGKSVAAANLANWAINCVKYHKIYVKVAPLMAKVKEATDTKNTAEASLAIVLQKAGGGGPGKGGGWLLTVHRLCLLRQPASFLDPGQVADIEAECQRLEEKLNGAVSETLGLGLHRFSPCGR